MLDCIKYVRPNYDGTILFAFGIHKSQIGLPLLFIVLILISFNLLGARLFGELGFGSLLLKLSQLLRWLSLVLY